MAGPIEPYRRAPGSVDAGADFARNLDRLERSLDQRLRALEAASVFELPSSQLIANCVVDADAAVHYVAHKLGRKYKAAFIAGYNAFASFVFTLPPEFVAAAGEDPAKVVGLYSQAGPGSNVLNVWVF